jgi:hypothetical protein
MFLKGGGIENVRRLVVSGRIVFFVSVRRFATDPHNLDVRGITAVHACSDYVGIARVRVFIRSLLIQVKDSCTGDLFLDVHG